MNGFILINKPPGITSLDVVKRVKRLFKERKVGHMGTLDPRACGLLIIGLGKYVRLEEYILRFPKTYIVEVLFGVSSDTYDREAYRFFYEKEKKQIDLRELEDTLRYFTGEIEQTPPPYSAIHIDGERAYNLARKNIPINLPKRRVIIYESKILDFNKSMNKVLIEFKVSSGTYIRSLVHDIGKKLNTKALVSFLARTQIGHLSVNQSISYSKLKEMEINNLLLSPVEVLSFPVYKIAKNEEKKILNGNSIETRLFHDGEYVSLINSQNKFIAVGKVIGNSIKPEKVFP